MRIVALRHLTPAQVRSALLRFDAAYDRDWREWLATPVSARPERLGEILRRWQATRPAPMRRHRAAGLHPAPHLEDLVEWARPALAALGPLTVRDMRSRTPAHDVSLAALWRTFAQLTVVGTASCVGISKAVMLVTDGAIGPAFDSRVRASLEVAPPPDAPGWIDTLQAVCDDIAAFERMHGPLEALAPPQFAGYGIGRLYDMAFGPGTDR